MGLPNILKAMRLLARAARASGSRSTRSPTSGRSSSGIPAEEADFRRFLAEGRLQLVGALDVMPDVNMPGGETFVRQMQYGKGYYREKLGVDVTTGWLLDTFGHHAQMPQLLRWAASSRSGSSAACPGRTIPSEFLWEGIDGTRIAAFWLPHSYGAALRLAERRRPRFAAFMQQRFDAARRRTAHGPDRVGLAGADVSEPEEHLVADDRGVQRATRTPRSTMRLAVPADFEAVVARRTDRPVFRGELNPIFQGTYSSRIELKDWMRTMERKLLTAEKLGAHRRAGWARPPIPTAIWRAWEPVLFNETHDLASGVMTDHVYEDTIRSYEFASRRADEHDRRELGCPRLEDRHPRAGRRRSSSSTRWAGRAPTSPRSTSASARRASVGVDRRPTPAARPSPSQVLEVDPLRRRRAQDGTDRLRRARRARAGIPRLSRRRRAVDQRDGQPQRSRRAGTGEIVLENDLYRVDARPRDRRDHQPAASRPGDWEVLSGPGNVVARAAGPRRSLGALQRPGRRQPDRHDRHSSRCPRRGQGGVQRRGQGRAGHDAAPGRSSPSSRSPTRSARASSRRPSGVYRRPAADRGHDPAGQQREVRPLPGALPDDDQGGQERRTRSPSARSSGPPAIEFPAQNWVDHGDGQHGLALLNIGLPGNVATDGTMMVSLLRAHTLGAYGFGGGYEPGMSSESGFQLGKERTMRYALVPHAGDWRTRRRLPRRPGVQPPAALPEGRCPTPAAAEALGPARGLRARRRRLGAQARRRERRRALASTRRPAGRRRAWRSSSTPEVDSAARPTCSRTPARPGSRGQCRPARPPPVRDQDRSGSGWGWAVDAIREGPVYSLRSAAEPAGFWVAWAESSTLRSAESGAPGRRRLRP